MRFKQGVPESRVHEILRGLRHPYTQRAGTAANGPGPSFVVQVPTSEKDAFAAQSTRLPEILDVGPAASIQLVVYFKKGVSEEDSSRLLRALGHPFHSGADSQKGKTYFYESGPPFLVDVPAAALDAFTAACAKLPEVKEVYEADWGAQAD